MVRMNLINARKRAHLTQLQLAQKLKVERQATIAEWESGKVTPSLYYQGRLCDILGCKDANLFDDVQLSVKDILEMLRREFINWIGKIGGTSVLGNVTLALVSTPAITQDEYIEQARTAIRACWELLSVGSFSTVKEVLNANMPKLAEIARTIGPFQHLAASLGVQGCIMQIILATRDTDFLKRESIGVEAVKLGELSGDRDLLATALDWHANTYTVCYQRPQIAVPILNQAISLKPESPLIKSALYSNLALSYAQDNTQDDYETKARNYIEQAHMLMPYDPALDISYQSMRWNHAVLNGIEGKVYLHLVDALPSSNYAQMAFDACDRSTNLRDISQETRGRTFIRKSDTLRALGDDMRSFADILEQGLSIAIQEGSKRQITDANDVLQRIPEKWQKEDKIITLQKEVARASSNLVTV